MESNYGFGSVFLVNFEKKVSFYQKMEFFLILKKSFEKILTKRNGSDIIKESEKNNAEKFFILKRVELC